MLFSTPYPSLLFFYVLFRIIEHFEGFCSFLLFIMRALDLFYIYTFFTRDTY